MMNISANAAETEIYVVCLLFRIARRITSKRSAAPTILGTVPRRENQVFPMKMNIAAGAIARASATTTVTHGFIFGNSSHFAVFFIRRTNAAQSAIATAR